LGKQEGERLRTASAWAKGMKRKSKFKAINWKQKLLRVNLLLRQIEFYSSIAYHYKKVKNFLAKNVKNSADYFL